MTDQPTIHIFRPPQFLARRILWCPVCEHRRRHVIALFVWYAAHITCCACGDSWADGERMPRPFRRGWRCEAVRQARAQWDEAQSWDDALADLHTAVEEQIRD